MKIDKVREMSDAELEHEIGVAEEKIWKLRFQSATGQTEGLGKIRGLRRGRARFKTILRERAMKESHGG